MIVVNQYPIVESGPAWLGFLLAVCCGIWGFIAIWALMDYRYNTAILSGVFCAFFLIGIIFVVHGKETGKTRYECLIDDKIPFAEVAENYDVIGRRGDLWILEDRVDE